MKRLLGPALLVTCLTLAACGGASSSEVAEDPAPSTSATASPTEEASPTAEAADYQEIALVSQTAAGGNVDPAAVPLDDDAARLSFLQQFRRPGFGGKIAKEIAAATVPAGYTLVGAVVSIGCDVPPGVNVEAGPDGWLITAQKVASPMQECFAPVTTVAIVAVPA